MTTSEKILQRNKNSMSFKQMGQILVLSDNLNKYKKALKWIEGYPTRNEAQKYIDAMCAEIDDYAKGGTTYNKK